LQNSPTAGAGNNARLTWGLNTKLRGAYDQNNQDGTNKRDIRTMNQSEHDTWSKRTKENKTEITWHNACELRTCGWSLWCFIASV